MAVARLFFFSSSKNATAYLRLIFKTMPVFIFDCSLIGSVSAKEFAINQQQLRMVNPWSWVAWILSSSSDLFETFERKTNTNKWRTKYLSVVDKLISYLQAPIYLRHLQECENLLLCSSPQWFDVSSANSRVAAFENVFPIWLQTAK